MANVFVWSGATGANDGSSWDNAYTTLMRDWGAEAGFTPATDFVYVRSVHAESTAGALTMTGSTAEGTTEPCRVICVVGDTTGTTPGNLATGASVTTTGVNDIAILEGLYIWGVDFFSGDDISLGTTSSDHDIVIESGRLELAGTNANDLIFLGVSQAVGCSIHLINTDFDFGSVSQGFTLISAKVKVQGGTVDTNTTNLIEFGATRMGTIDMIGVDLSNVSGNLVQASQIGNSNQITFTRCLLHASVTLVNGTMDVPGAQVSSFHCQSGTDADPAYQMQIETDRGTVSTDTAEYRTGGASDGERTNPISWKMDTSVGSKRQWPGHPLESPPIVGWTDGDGTTSHTYRIYFASGGTQDEKDLWFVLTGPNDAATNSLGIFPGAAADQQWGTRIDPEGTEANYTTDGTSTWVTAGTKQYMELSYTPDKPGPISARVYMVTDAGSTGQIWIDPKIYIDPYWLDSGSTPHREQTLMKTGRKSISTRPWPLRFKKTKPRLAPERTPKVRWVCP